MKSVMLGQSGLKVSNLCLGTADFGLKTDEETAFAILDRFREMGGTFLDTANVYCKWVPGKGNCSERVIGKWLKSRGASEMVVATKGGHYSFLLPYVSRVKEKEVRRDLEESLRSLGLECIPFYWLHRDRADTPPEELDGWMQALVREGKIARYGISNITCDRVRAFGSRLAGVSNQWSYALESAQMRAGRDRTLVTADAELLSWLREASVPLIPYTSGAHGCFAKMEKGLPVRGGWDTEANRTLYAALSLWAGRLGVTCFQLGQAWLLHQPFQVVPVMAVSRPEQLEDLQVISSLELPAACVEDLDRARTEAEGKG